MYFNRVQPSLLEVCVSNVCPNRKDAHTGCSEQPELTHLRGNTFLTVRGLAPNVRKCTGTNAQPQGSAIPGTSGQSRMKLLGKGRFGAAPCLVLGPAQPSCSPSPFSSAWQCFTVKQMVLARTVTTLFSVKKHFPLQNRHKFQASAKAPFQSVVTMASFSSADAPAEIFCLYGFNKSSQIMQGRALSEVLWRVCVLLNHSMVPGAVKVALHAHSPLG